ncbi:MAG: penicillin-binding protein 2 [Anaerolineae bacterium]|nr:penicillin-binding protein 2 [Anaerolineae bacterium]
MMRGPEARLRLVTALLIAALLPVIGQLLRLQVLDRDRYQAEVEELVMRPYALPLPPAGTVRDRNGDLLVGNIPIYGVGAQIDLITDTQIAAAALAPLLDLDEATLLEKFVIREDEEDLEWVWHRLAHGIRGDNAEAIKKLKERWDWLTLEPTWQRFYPESELASHTLGFVNADGNGYGIEASQFHLLQPRPAVGMGEVDVLRVPLSEELAKGELRAFAGTDITLTIDRTIQAFVEGELDKALALYGASGGTILVMNPQTGEILASASYPDYNPSLYSTYDVSEQDRFVDPVVSVVYEPGSVFKIFTVAAALDSGSVTQDWSYYDSGLIEYGGVLIRNSDSAGHGQQNLQGVIDRSLNVGVATLTTQFVGADVFADYVLRFGFGRPTNVGLFGETAGLVHLPWDLSWQDGYLVTNAFGQGIAVTPIQMATAASALANHGTMMKPRLITERRTPEGRVVPIPPKVAGQPVSAETADYVVGLMEHAVETSIVNAQVPGYRIAGKTGTAQIPVSGGYDSVEVITSFIGFGPLPDPELLILVKLDRPQVDLSVRWGTQTAAPVFNLVASRLFVLLGIPPTEPIDL